MSNSVLVFFSGGVDSAFALQYYLAKTDWHVHSHHVSLRTIHRGRRWGAEDECARRMITWFRRHHRGFESTESRLDLMGMQETGFPENVFAMLGSLIAPNLPGEHVSLAFGWYEEENARTAVLRAREAIRVPVRKLWPVLVESMPECHRRRMNLNLSSPFEAGLDKKGIVAGLPAELVKMAWYCHTPNRLPSGAEYVPCGKCKACVEFQAATEGLDL